MARTRISTTVDADLLKRARSAQQTDTDAELIDLALGALIAQLRAAEIDSSYAEAYEHAPLDTEDAWGDLASFRRAASQ